MPSSERSYKEGPADPDILLNVRTKYNILSELTAATEKILREGKLSLQTHLSQDFLSAASGRRISVILNPWRENVAVIIYFSEGGIAYNKERPGSELLLEHELAIFLHLWVNRQNTPSPNDWHMPTEEQRATWLKAVSKEIVTALNTTCRTVDRIDSETILCDN